MPDTLLFAMEATLNGLTAGVMYALVALGFVLIFKASGIFNFAQGVMALFAALTLVGFQSGQIPFSHLINAIFGTRLHHFGWNMPTLLAIPATVLVMILLAVLVERFILKHLVNQEPIILFMATIGLAYFLEGVGDIMWGAEVKALDVGLPKGMSETVDDVTFAWFGYGEGFLMRVAAIRCALARPRPALENLPRTKPRGSWCDLWGKCADGWGDGCVRGSVESAHDG
jgi:branched-chain amino acid transport system permease protein